MDDPVGYCLAQELTACLCAQLLEVSAPVDCCCLMPGQQVVWDDCNPGQAWVRTARIYPVGANFPTPAAALDSGVCGGIGGWAVTFELGVLRCMPQPTENGELPACEENAAVSRLVAADAHAMRRAVLCCDWRQPCALADARIVVGDWLPLGPQGTCTGGTMTVTVEATACVCDPAPPAPSRR